MNKFYNKYIEQGENNKMNEILREFSAGFKEARAITKVVVFISLLVGVALLLMLNIY